VSGGAASAPIGSPRFPALIADMPHSVIWGEDSAQNVEERFPMLQGHKRWQAFKHFYFEGRTGKPRDNLMLFDEAGEFIGLGLFSFPVSLFLGGGVLMAPIALTFGFDMFLRYLALNLLVGF
jgi:hypothetical protein